MYGFTNMNFISLVLLIITLHGYSIALSCCSKTETDCGNVCEEMVMQKSHMSQLEQLTRTAQHCPPSQVGFWRCVNSTVSVVQAMAVWPGQPCCELANEKACKASCNQVRGQDHSHNIENCNHSTERPLYNCLQKYRDGERCCRSANSFNCHFACLGTVMVDRINRAKQRNIIRGQCNKVSSSLIRCLQKGQGRVTKVDSSSSGLPCCYEAAEGSLCREACIRGKQSHYSQEHLANELDKHCGPVLPTVPIWACFLKSQPEQRQKSDTVMSIIDGARLQCCYKASTVGCKNLCSRTYSTDWAQSWIEFNNQCQSLSAPVLDGVMDAPMSTCLAEVEQPCKLGCSGLSYCSNFNNRPTEMFRNCDAVTDKAARQSIESWQNGTINLPQMTIPVKNINECEPEMWKALACALQIKPCARKATLFPLCREDCFYILDKCVDYQRLKPGHTLQILCNRLSPGESRQGSCLSVKKYLTESPNKSKAGEISNPCKGNPCGDGEVCWINRRKCRHPDCKPFVCHKACGMGQNSNVLIPRNFFVRIPDAQANQRSEKCIHYKVCQCRHNQLTNCKPTACIKQDHCVLAQGHLKRHGEHFRIDCNHCICNSGNMVCTKRRCMVNTDSKGHLGLPCDCSRSYSPRCGANGKTYPNSCVANRCAKLHMNEISAGRCTENDPCNNNKCSPDERCVVRRQVCLSTSKEGCRQYECVPVMQDRCNRHHHDPMCDSTGEEFTNACLLLLHKRRPAYRGHCQKHCSTKGTVCGHNGETYDSECAALAARTTVDYTGVCQVLAHSTGNTTSSDCANIKCSPIKPKQCRPITPPGGCCPVCAAELRVLFSTELANSAADAMDEHQPITVFGILEVLSHQLSVAECDIFGYLTVENDLVLLLGPVTASPTMLQVQACVKEAERISYLIQTDSPLLKSFLTLTPLLMAPIRTPGVFTQSSAASLCSSNILLLVTLLSIIYSVLKRT